MVFLFRASVKKGFISSLFVCSSAWLSLDASPSMDCRQAVVETYDSTTQSELWVDSHQLQADLLTSSQKAKVVALRVKSDFTSAFMDQQKIISKAAEHGIILPLELATQAPAPQDASSLYMQMTVIGEPQSIQNFLSEISAEHEVFGREFRAESDRLKAPTELAVVSLAPDASISDLNPATADQVLILNPRGDFLVRIPASATEEIQSLKQVISTDQEPLHFVSSETLAVIARKLESDENKQYGQDENGNIYLSIYQLGLFQKRADEKPGHVSLLSNAVFNDLNSQFKVSENSDPEAIEEPELEKAEEADEAETEPETASETSTTPRAFVPDESTFQGIDESTVAPAPESAIDEISNGGESTVSNGREEIKVISKAGRREEVEFSIQSLKRSLFSPVRAEHRQNTKEGQSFVTGQGQRIAWLVTPEFLAQDFEAALDTYAFYIGLDSAEDLKPQFVQSLRQLADPELSTPLSEINAERLEQDSNIASRRFVNSHRPLTLIGRGPDATSMRVAWIALPLNARFVQRETADEKPDLSALVTAPETVESPSEPVVATPLDERPEPKPEITIEDEERGMEILAALENFKGAINAVYIEMIGWDSNSQREVIRESLETIIEGIEDPIASFSPQMIRQELRRTTGITRESEKDSWMMAIRQRQEADQLRQSEVDLFEKVFLELIDEEDSESDLSPIRQSLRVAGRKSVMDQNLSSLDQAWARVSDKDKAVIRSRVVISDKAIKEINERARDARIVFQKAAEIAQRVDEAGNIVKQDRGHTLNGTEIGRVFYVRFEGYEFIYQTSGDQLILLSYQPGRWRDHQRNAATDFDGRYQAAMTLIEQERQEASR